jgi:hypothetical protein
VQHKNHRAYSTKMETGTKARIAIGAFFIVMAMLLGAWAGSSITAAQKDRELEEILGLNSTLHTEITSTNNRVKSLSGSLKSLSDENTRLTDLVAELKNRPTKIEYVTRVETVVVPDVRTETFEKPPEEYLFELKPELPVARFSYDADAEQPYGFETYSLTFRNSIVISERNSTALLQISSEKNPETFIEVPIDDLTVDYVEEQKLFEPHVGAGLTLGAGVKPDLMGSIFVSFIHPTKNVDTIGLRVAANGSNVHFVFDAVGYNIGHHIPVFTDLWLHAGAGIDIRATPYGHISLGTKF